MKDFSENTEKKLYSSRAISVATFIGGPLAAGILIRRNFINMGKGESGLYALAIGVISTLLIFSGIFLMPEHIIDSIPNAAIPAVYTIITSLIVEQLMGDELKQHKERNGVFYSWWNTAGVGTASLTVIIGTIFMLAIIIPDQDQNKINRGIAEFAENEEKALELFSFIDHVPAAQISNFIQKEGIPLWQKNLEIIQSLNLIEGIDEQMIRQNEILKEYCLLRIKTFQLIEKSILEDTEKYLDQIWELNDRIDQILEML